MSHSNTEADRLNDVLNRVVEFLKRFMYFERSEQADAVALWIVGTYVFDVYEVTPYLSIRSPEKGSGKTRLLELMELLVHKPKMSANISPAALYRLVDRDRPTLLLDEIDTVFNSGRNSDSQKQELRGLINAGYRKGMTADRANKVGGLESFSTFCPKALSGIGPPPDTIADRCILIGLQRKPKDAKRERFRRRKIAGEGRVLQKLIEAVTSDLDGRLVQADPKLPDELTDREQDTWELLLAIADEAGVGWPDRGRKAAIVLAEDAVDDTETASIQLLGDIRSVFHNDEEALPTEMLIERLCAIEEAPWSDWFGRPISPRWLANHLKPFGVKSQSVRHPSLTKTKKGYRRDHLEPVWSRYLANDDTPPEHAVIDNSMDPF